MLNLRENQELRPNLANCLTWELNRIADLLTERYGSGQYRIAQSKSISTKTIVEQSIQSRLI